MGYQSKTYSLSDEVVGRIEAEREKGRSPDQFLWSLMFKAKKPTKREQTIAQIRASDPMSSERPDVEYGSDQLPSGGSVIQTSFDARGIPLDSSHGKASTEVSLPNWRKGRKPLLKPGDKK